MNGAPSTLRYQKPALRRDYWRAGAGLAMTVALILLVNPGSVGFYVVAVFGAIFLIYAVHTYLKQSTLIELDERGATRRFSGPVGNILRTRHIAFDEIDRFALRYYGRRHRDRGKGIVELTIGAGPARLTADQALEQFDLLVKTARQAAQARGLELDSATEANLSALGYR